MSRYLNWSFDYTSHHAAGVKFDEKLYSILENRNGTADELKYAVLANYRFNHKNPAILKTDDIEIGELCIKKEKKKDDKWKYIVKYFDISSGEYLDLNYLCEDDVYGSLSEEWNLADNNLSMYAPYICSGKLIKGEYETNVLIEHPTGRVYSIGKVKNDSSIICNYTLFDTIPKMVENDIKEFAVFEGLERLYPNQRLGYFEEDTLNINFQNQKIRGYYMHGTGVPPCYWWVGENKKVIIMSTTLLTYVLRN